MKLEYNSENLLHAKELRKNLTPQERKLWYGFLSTYPVRFFRQRMIGKYIVDFYCASADLVVEIDGSQHFSECGEKHDQIRTDFLQSKGLFVMRFSNKDVNESFKSVCEQIDQYVQNHIR